VAIHSALAFFPPGNSFGHTSPWSSQPDFLGYTRDFMAPEDYEEAPRTADGPGSVAII